MKKVIAVSIFTLSLGLMSFNSGNENFSKLSSFNNNQMNQKTKTTTNRATKGFKTTIFVQQSTIHHWKKTEKTELENFSNIILKYAN